MSLKSILGAPKSVSELLATGARTVRWLIDGIIAPGANVLIGGAPKSNKTLAALEVAVSIATGTEAFGRFQTRTTGEVGIVAMEGVAEQIGCHLTRIAEAHGRGLADITDRIHTWYRPALMLDDANAMASLQSWVHDLPLRALIIDNLGLVAVDSNDADAMTRQFKQLSALRRGRPDLAIVLIHHTRKGSTNGPEDRRLSDEIRNSSVIPSWYDTGLLLQRRSEQDPVTVRTEHRADAPVPRWQLDVEDEVPGDAHEGVPAQGYLRLTASPVEERKEPRSRTADVTARVVAFVRDHPGCTKGEIRKSVSGKSAAIDEALASLIQVGVVHVDKSGSGHAHRLV